MSDEVEVRQTDLIRRAREAADGLDLAELEEVLADSVGGFLAFIASVASVHDRKLYLKTHESFDLWCREKVGMTAKTARRQMAQAEATVDGKVPSQRSMAKGTRASLLADPPTPGGSIEAKSEEVPTNPDMMLKRLQKMRAKEFVSLDLAQLRHAAAMFAQALAERLKGESPTAVKAAKREPVAGDSKCPHNMRHVQTGACLKCGHVR